MKTRQDLIAAALELLNAVAAGQAPEPEDVQAIDSRMDGLLEEVGINVNQYFNADDGIEDRYLAPLAVVVANEFAPGFGQPQNADSRQIAISRIRAMQPATYFGEPQWVDYY